MSGQHVLEEAADEDAGIEAHDLRGVAVGVVFLFEGDGVVVDVDDAVVADCNLVGVAGEVAQHLLRTTEWRFRVDDPFHGGGVVEATLKVVVGDALEPTTTELRIGGTGRIFKGRPHSTPGKNALLFMFAVG
jgi:hypothetical protein